MRALTGSGASLLLKPRLLALVGSLNLADQASPDNARGRPKARNSAPLAFAAMPERSSVTKGRFPWLAYSYGGGRLRPCIIPARYVPIDYIALLYLLARIKLRPDDVFVDIGCG